MKKLYLFFIVGFIFSLFSCAPPTPVPVPTLTRIPLATNTPLPPTAISTATRVPATPTNTPIPATPTPLPPMSLTSPAFQNDGAIPLRHAQRFFRVGNFACFGTGTGRDNISPALNWANVPLNAQSLALVMVDRFEFLGGPKDAEFNHWIVFNIPPTLKGFSEGLPADATLSNGALQAENDYPAPYALGYGGPCPGSEKHQYVFTLYALDIRLNLAAGAKGRTVTPALQGHILAQAKLQAFYQDP